MFLNFWTPYSITVNTKIETKCKRFKNDMIPPYYLKQEISFKKTYKT